MRRPNWSPYISGYKEAGDLLLEHVLAGGKQNTLVYPVVFLYRHYIELQLKEIIQEAGAYLGIAEKSQMTHDITMLWAIFRDVLKRIDEPLVSQLSEDQYRKVKGYYDALHNDLNVFSSWDPTSQSFRYPVDNTGNPVVVDLKNIKFQELKGLIARISSELGGISTGLYDFLTAQT